MFVKCLAQCLAQIKHSIYQQLLLLNGYHIHFLDEDIEALIMYTNPIGIGRIRTKIQKSPEVTKLFFTTVQGGYSRGTSKGKNRISTFLCYFFLASFILSGSVIIYDLLKSENGALHIYISLKWKCRIYILISFFPPIQQACSL